jgi:uncharacterized protein
MDTLKLKEFVEPYYKGKDIMHDILHIERVLKSVDRLIKNIRQPFDMEAIIYAAYFHGFIYNAEREIIVWLKNNGIADDKIKSIIKAAWESQKSEVPDTIEGKILHDAHRIEGGKTYLIVKSLITGSVRGQTLEQTNSYIDNNILGKGCCYLPEAQKIYAEQQEFAMEFIKKLKEGLS